MSTTYRAKFLLAAFFLAGGIVVAVGGQPLIAVFCGVGAGALTMDGIWSGWWRAHSTLYPDLEAVERRERERIIALLDGIDRDELDDEGWWETTTGAAFGASILRQIKEGS